KAVKENYHAVLVTLKNGRTYTGIKVQQDANRLVLRTAEDREVSLPRKDVEEEAPAGSLMPEGLTDNLTHGELIDLVRFLSELGKVGPYSVGKERLARRWQVLEASPQAVGVLQRGGLVAATGEDPALVWAPAYSTVAGVLPPDSVPRLEL